jgi:hypothetical protein
VPSILLRDICQVLEEAYDPPKHFSTLSLRGLCFERLNNLFLEGGGPV